MPHTFSFEALACLFVILTASFWTFFELTRRWTADRPRAAMADWARDTRFKLLFAPKAELPKSLTGLATENPQVEISLIRGPVVILKLTTATRQVNRRAEWHILIRELDRAWKPMALRPATAKTSFIDLFSLNGFPSLLPPERFIIYANESKDARAMAASTARGLLPADIGLLIHGPYVTLDFSPRPFDPVEINRMIVITEQLTAHLPAAG